MSTNCSAAMTQFNGRGTLPGPRYATAREPRRRWDARSRIADRLPLVQRGCRRAGFRKIGSQAGAFIAATLAVDGGCAPAADLSTCRAMRESSTSSEQRGTRASLLEKL